MRRRTNRPEQLHLELQWQYLNWLSEAGERDDFYETTSLALLKGRPKLVPRGPLWPEKKIFASH